MNIEQLEEIRCVYYPIPYSYSHCPVTVESNGGLMQDGINCQTFFNKVFTDLTGIPLKPELRSLEIYLNSENLFDCVDISEELNPFDIFLFGPENLNDFKKLHLSIFLGMWNMKTDQPIIHDFSFVNKGYGETELSKIMENRLLYGIRRHRQVQEEISPYLFVS